MSNLPRVSKLYSPEFPSGWTPYYLHDLAEWINGMAFRNIHFSSSGLPVLKIAEIKSGFTQQTKYTEAEYDDKYFVSPRDLLFCWSGQPETSIDTFRWQEGNGWLNQHIFRVIPNEELVNEGYFYYLMKHLKPIFVNIARNKQTTGLGHVTKGDLRQLQVSLPSREIQEEVAFTLSSIDEKITSNQRLIRLLEDQMQAQFNLWFPTEYDESGVQISDLVSVNPKRVLKKGDDATYIGMSSLPEHSAIITEWETKPFGSGQKFINGDVLMARITPCLENGKTAIVDMLADDEVGWGSTEYIVLAPKGEITTPWIYCLARTKEIRSYAIRSMTGSSGRQRFQASGFDFYRIPMVNQELLKSFNSFSVPVFEKMAQLRDESLHLASVRDTLIPELISGRHEDSALLRQFEETAA